GEPRIRHDPGDHGQVVRFPGARYGAAGHRRRSLKHDPEKACPGLDPGWRPVFGKDHASAKSMIPKKPAPDLIRGGNRFSEKIMLGKISDRLQENVFFSPQR